MAGIMKNKNIIGATKQVNTQSDYSTQRSTSTSNGLSWTTSHVSNATANALKKAEKPYSSPYEHQLGSALSQINNRKKFEYDLNEDALYKQYADNYKLLGQQAMQDTMASAATLTGGYGSSYATTAGQQAYNSYLNQLNDIVPTLYQQAKSNYDTDTQNLYNKANLYQGLESEAYNRFVQNRSYYSDKYNNEWNRNAVTHSSQTESSNTTSTSRSTTSSNNYTYQKPTITLPTPEKIKAATGKYENAKSFMQAYGLHGTDNLKSWYKWKAEKEAANKKNDVKTPITYGQYTTYLTDQINNGIKQTYGDKKMNNENSKSDKNKKKKK